MRNLTFLIICTFVLIGCSPKNEKIIKEFVNAYNNSDEEKLKSLLSENIVITYESGENRLNYNDFINEFKTYSALQTEIAINELIVNENKTTTTEVLSNYTTRELNIPPAVFKKEYTISDGKILKIHYISWNQSDEYQRKSNNFFKWIGKNYPVEYNKLTSQIKSKIPFGNELRKLVDIYKKEALYSKEEEDLLTSISAIWKETRFGKSHMIDFRGPQRLFEYNTDKPYDVKIEKIDLKNESVKFSISEPDYNEPKETIKIVITLVKIWESNHKSFVLKVFEETYVTANGVFYKTADSRPSLFEFFSEL